MLTVVRRWDTSSCVSHLVSYSNFVGVRLVAMHFLSEKLDLLLLEVTWTYQLCPIHSFLLVYI